MNDVIDERSADDHRDGPADGQHGPVVTAAETARLTGGQRFWAGAAVTLTIAGVLIVLNQVFFWNPGGFTLLLNAFLYVVLACFLSQVFILVRARKSADRSRFSVPWYDAVLAVVCVATNLYFAVHAEDISLEGWDYAAPPLAVAGSFVLWLLVLEALRRTAGLVVTIIAGAFSLYPLIAEQMPIGFLQGVPFPIERAATVHALGPDSILGLPLQTAGAILIGFLVFGVVLQRTGGAEFFIDLARSVFGHARGGSAKVAVTSSASMGMMSGSAVSNVLTTGPMTIPAMKRAGYPGTYAAGIEATAATGGSITPPIMGTAAFLMVSFLGIPYSEVAQAAAAPALLYYVGVFTQVDAYAARTGMRGEPRSRLPKALATLRTGWPYLLALGALILLLVWQRDEAQAPFMAAALLLAIAVVRPRHRLGARGLLAVVVDSGRSIAEIVGIIAGVGLIVGALSMSGASLSLARELVAAVGDNVLLILIAGAVTCFVLGMGMTVSAVYVFLAIVMAPALIELGVNPVAAHLFVIYWAAASYITPPVALAAFAAAGIARSSPMATAVTAMRLGAAKYIVPFCFALNPALVAQDDVGSVLQAVGLAIVGVFAMGAAFEGYAPLVEVRMPGWARAVALAGGVALLLPETVSSMAGLVVVVALLAGLRLFGHHAGPPERRGDDAAAADAVAAAAAGSGEALQGESLRDESLPDGAGSGERREGDPEVRT
ncbi:TRAP transporter 4TM/12TM fusion protein [Prauserella sediminis]|uniref:TRAP transporter 4TM/12TM fusion protein n=1 Tax=Prauserella sediminis TaxID=577680 RepID=A0A839XSS8_9PSEU|nr:TRAP transporter permease [Prauserella sediminis]MBB3664028.1 TRAP transporter 4TM/12TM fusion protein [Prauserella sediminis]